MVMGWSRMALAFSPKRKLVQHVEHYLAKDIVRSYDVLNESFVQKVKVEYAKHPDATAIYLWRVLQLQMWYEHWMR